MRYIKFFLISAVIFIIGCANKTLKTFHFEDCPSEIKDDIQKHLERTYLTVQSCLTNHGRSSDGRDLQSLLPEIKVKCDSSAEKPFIAKAHAEDKSLTVLYKFFDSSSSASYNLPPVLGHELIHLLKYYHFENFDLPYVVELCCFDPNNSQTSAIQKETRTKACDLFKYKNSDWTTVEYNRDFSNVLKRSLRSDIGIATALRAANVAFEERNDKAYGEDVLKASILESMPSLFQSSPVPEVQKVLAETYFPTKAFVLLTSINKPDLVESKKNLQQRFFKKSKSIPFLTLYGKLIGNLLFNERKEFVKNWKKITSLEKKFCQKLSKVELDGLRSLSADTFLIVVKNETEINRIQSGLLVIEKWQHLCQPSS